MNTSLRFVCIRETDFFAYKSKSYKNKLQKLLYGENKEGSILYRGKQQKEKRMGIFPFAVL